MSDYKAAKELEAKCMDRMLQLQAVRPYSTWSVNQRWLMLFHKAHLYMAREHIRQEERPWLFRNPWKLGWLRDRTKVLHSVYLKGELP